VPVDETPQVNLSNYVSAETRESPGASHDAGSNVATGSGAYAWYALLALLGCSILNYLDRSILTILAEEIKSDLRLSDADLGFLAGTAFAVFYATFGLVLGRLADLWNRTRLISLGVTLWSLMTVLSGAAPSFLPLALARFGVAVGEAGANPASYSLIYDYFPRRRRTLALAIHASGMSIGTGLGLLIGGAVLTAWQTAWPDPTDAPLALKGWQFAFMLVGLPGLLMALWVASLREPLRGSGDSILSVAHPEPFRETARLLMSMLPIVSWFRLAEDSNGKMAIGINILATGGISGLVVLLVLATRNPVQWVALGAGLYAFVSWAQSMAIRDPIVFAMIFRCRTLVALIVGQTAFASLLPSLGFWAVPFFQREFDLGAAEIGTILGLGGPVVGISGLLVGGLLSDRLSTVTLRAKMWVWAGGSISAIASAVAFLFAGNYMIAAAALLGVYFFMSIAGAPIIGALNDLVLPRSRATVSSLTFTVTSLFGAALGPFLVGSISDLFVTDGASAGSALRLAMLWGLVLPLAGLIPSIYALLHAPADQQSLLQRARALGEPV